ncbi:hypothetical protein K227x_48590 [Rubripirellula lacrimiformis]|uniref:Uncharacterized protein n=1 Tax=Rubripirellula lacrimiformis TaxID=1930273 RepID=A0A517NH37_9BACT|nr:hypothetical protein [Rubripirellula lacrimiformis]QDT06449.1 hypothetical protein K227x_48590 [Rubripirellula lacrimiformis]
MNSIQTLEQPSSLTTAHRCDEALENTKPAAESVVSPPAVPMLENIVDAIRLDAMHDSLRYVLRSNTGHDGE